MLNGSEVFWGGGFGFICSVGTARFGSVVVQCLHRPAPAAKIQRMTGKSQGEGESEESETSLQVWRNSPAWNINALPHPFFCLHSTSCHSNCNDHLSPLPPCASLLSSSSTLLLHFSLTQPRMSPVILFIPFFSPFCRSFPPIEVHTSQVSTRPYTLLPSLRGSAVVTGRVDDRQGQTLLISSSLLYRHTQLVGHSI